MFGDRLVLEEGRSPRQKVRTVVTKGRAVEATDQEFPEVLHPHV
jgi:hypothetical protein